MQEIEGPERFVAWWRSYRKSYPSFHFDVSYHPRSDEHSKLLCTFVLEDLVAACPLLREHAMRGAVCYDVNHVVHRTNSTEKVLDLVVGQPAERISGDGIRRGKVTSTGIRIALEAKACMTKHHSAWPRLRNELEGSMADAVNANTHAVVGGVVVVNAATSFMSPTHQPDPLPRDPSSLRRRPHKQPKDAAFVVESLGKLVFRLQPPDVGFDSLGVIVVRHDNEVPVPSVELVEGPPSPPSTSPRSYRSFIIDMANKYRLRFGA
jgi:hypothetical protein